MKRAIIAGLLFLLLCAGMASAAHLVIYRGVTPQPKYAAAWAGFLPSMRYQNASQAPIKCLHGIIITDRYGRQSCVGALRGAELRAYTANLTNLSNSTNTTKPVFYYYRANCTAAPARFAQSCTVAVKSSHPLTCAQIKAAEGCR